MEQRLPVLELFEADHTHAILGDMRDIGGQQQGSGASARRQKILSNQSTAKS